MFRKHTKKKIEEYFYKIYISTFFFWPGVVGFKMEKEYTQYICVEERTRQGQNYLYCDEFNTHTAFSTDNINIFILTNQNVRNEKVLRVVFNIKYFIFPVVSFLSSKHYFELNI